MNQLSDPIAVFDSGMGGISVLREMTKLMPNEDFIYYGDSKHRPKTFPGRFPASVFPAGD